jgi:hypothetical protein
MKKLIFILILALTILATACDATISESAMETAVSQVILTSSSSEASEPTEEQTESQSAAPSSQELEEANTQLNAAQTKLTEQADEISALKAELEQVYPLLTPTITPTPFNTPTPANTATPTPRPTVTVFTLPYYQKYVTPIDNAALYYYKHENDAGFPLMLKTEPIKKFALGEEFIVDTNRIRSDGGGYFYLVVGPKNAGFYVRIEDVEIIKE